MEEEDIHGGRHGKYSSSASFSASSSLSSSSSWNTTTTTPPKSFRFTNEINATSKLALEHLLALFHLGVLESVDPFFVDSGIARLHKALGVLRLGGATPLRETPIGVLGRWWLFVVVVVVVVVVAAAVVVVVGRVTFVVGK
jgi:hypothetical protein